MHAAFNWFHKKTSKVDKPTPPARRVVIQGLAAPTPPPAPAEPTRDPFRSKLLFHDLHADTNPSEHVRTAHMTCPSCSTSFRYFVNSDGKKTLVKCPGCAKTYRA